MECYYCNDIPLSIRNKPTKHKPKKHFTSFIFLSINNSKLYIYLLCGYSFFSYTSFLLSQNKCLIKWRIISLLYFALSTSF